MKFETIFLAKVSENGPEPYDGETEVSFNIEVHCDDCLTIRQFMNTEVDFNELMQFLNEQRSISRRNKENDTK